MSCEGLGRLPYMLETLHFKPSGHPAAARRREAFVLESTFWCLIQDFGLSFVEAPTTWRGGSTSIEGQRCRALSIPIKLLSFQQLTT